MAWETSCSVGMKVALPGRSERQSLLLSRSISFIHSPEKKGRPGKAVSGPRSFPLAIMIAFAKIYKQIVTQIRHRPNRLLRFLPHAAARHGSQVYLDIHFCPKAPVLRFWRLLR